MIFISKDANPALLEFLQQRGHIIRQVTGESDSLIKWDISHSPIRSHPDLYMCKLGALPQDPVWFGEGKYLGPVYPDDVLYNCAVAGRRIICSRYTDQELIRKASEYIADKYALSSRHPDEESNDSGSAAVLIRVPQGYAKCNLAVIDDNHLITEDEGIYRKLCTQPRLHILKIRPRHVALNGYPYGFIGGCCGRIGNEIVFNGNVTHHPDFLAMAAFIKGRGLNLRWFGGPLTDIGSIIECPDR